MGDLYEVTGDEMFKHAVDTCEILEEEELEFQPVRFVLTVKRSSEIFVFEFGVY